VDTLSRAGEAASVDDRYEAAQKVEIEHARTIYFSTEIDYII
jgi:hypothetical protein